MHNSYTKSMKYLFSAILMTLAMTVMPCMAKGTVSNSFSGNVVADEGAWCWFADPRAIEFVSKDGSMRRTFIGYIDRHGSVKATQVDRIAGTTEEVMVRSWFQPDDHNNPAFLVLPDDRIMIIYSRHTDEPCFYYRISREPGDITMLGEEKVLKTSFNTTYPNPYILSDDPQHIYMCWRGTNWHPTVARMTMPDKDDNIRFDWGPHQMVQSSGARPYAKYMSNGKDKIYVAYTTGHPDNEYPNWLYCNVFDVNTRQLSDIKGNILSTVGTTQVRRTEEYLKAHPFAVVDHPTDSRDWIWNMAFDKQGNPVIGMTHISKDKHSHSYYYAKWTGKEWQKTFIADGGGHFHQSPETENCYSGGMAVDRNNPSVVYCSVPVNGVYEIMRYTMSEDGKAVVSSEAVTHDSKKNNARPYVTEAQCANSSVAEGSEGSLYWMNGDYYFWIVNTRYPLGYPTSIMSAEPLPKQKKAPKGQKSFTYSFAYDEYNFGGEIFTWQGVTVSVDKESLRLSLTVDGKECKSQNKFATADSWATDDRATTDGKWYRPVVPKQCKLTVTRLGDVVTLLRDGVIDLRVDISE